MKLSLCFFVTLGLTVLSNSCLYEEPVFTSSFSKTEASMTGVWVFEEQEGDPPTSPYAVCVPIDDDRYVLHHPARSSDSF